jgi:hypothetical protein
LNVPAAGLAWPEEFPPQQARAPVVFRPQPCDAPAEAELKVPDGGTLAWPERFLPQQAPVPSVLTPQTWEPPAEMEVKVPPNGVDWP